MPGTQQAAQAAGRKDTGLPHRRGGRRVQVDRLPVGGTGADDRANGTQGLLWVATRPLAGRTRRAHARPGDRRRAPDVDRERERLQSPSRARTRPCLRVACLEGPLAQALPRLPGRRAVAETRRGLRRRAATARLVQFPGIAAPHRRRVRRHALVQEFGCRVWAICWRPRCWSTRLRHGSRSSPWARSTGSRNTSMPSRSSGASPIPACSASHALPEASRSKPRRAQ
jgi:hypothetical protein